MSSFGRVDMTESVTNGTPGISHASDPPPMYQSPRRSPQSSTSEGKTGSTDKNSFSSEEKSMLSNNHTDAHMATLAQSLSLDDPSEPNGLPTVDQTIAHLELLEAFYALKTAVSGSDGLFDLFDTDVRIPDTTGTEGSSLLAEKRWAVFVTRAVDRFCVWWECLRKKVDAQMLDPSNTEGQVSVEVADELAKRPVGSRDDLPPLGKLIA